MVRSLYKKSSSASILPYLLIITATILTTLTLWFPFILRVDSINHISTPHLSFQTVLSHWDSPLYIIPAKTAYNPSHPIMQSSPLGLDSKYFAAHLPGYPATIALIAPFFGYVRATILSTLLFSTIFFSFFYFVLKKLKLTANPLVLTIVLLFLTPRFFVVRSIGSPEPMYMLFILASIYFFARERLWLSVVAAGLATITKTPAILLFFAYGLFFAHQYWQTRKFEFGWLKILLIPMALLGLFLFYKVQYNDFLAYFNSGDNLHLIFPPFSVFNYQKNWVASGWLEEIVFIYFIYLFTIITLWEKIKKNISDPVKERFYTVSLYFSAIFFVSLILVQHRDIARYSLPLLPIAVIVFEKFLTSRVFLICLFLLIPAIYLYAWNFMLTNTAPIADWSVFL